MENYKNTEGKGSKMLEGIWKKIKSGSDIRGIAEGSEEKIDLSNKVVEKVALAFVMWLAKRNNLDYPSITIAVGHDSRNSASRIKNVIINSLRSLGIKIYDCALTSTPAMYMSMSVLSCTASIEITASHHPSDRNGLKFFVSDGGISADELSEILEIAQEGSLPSLDKKGTVRFVNLMEYYSEKLRNLILDSIPSEHNKPLEGFKIIVDAGNGVGGFFANDVLKPLGANIEGSQFLNPDGKFPNHIPNPEEPEAIKSITEAVKREKADLGIIFDTDVDRAAVVDCDGHPISKNRLIALASSMVLKNNPDSVIVTDSVTSDYLKSFIENLGGSQFRYKRGYHNVIEMAKEINSQGENCPLAIETSGHAAFKENKFIDDGAYLACKIVIEMVKLKKENKTFENILVGLVSPKEEITIKIPIKQAPDKSLDEISIKVLNDFKNSVNSSKHMDLEKNNIEGIRVNFNYKNNKGWLLLRRSVHDPVLVLYAESYTFNYLKNMLKSIKPFLAKKSELDLSNFEKQL